MGSVKHVFLFDKRFFFKIIFCVFREYLYYAERTPLLAPRHFLFSRLGIKVIQISDKDTQTNEAILSSPADERKK